MRIAFLPDGESVNAVYRSIAPMRALGFRGHEVRQLELSQIDDWPAILRWCDLLHVHRACDQGVVELARAARLAGAAVVWDDDDDVTQVPRSVSGYKIAGGMMGQRRLAARASLFEHVDLVTTPSAALAETFRAGGARETHVLENYAIDDFVRDRRTCDRLVVGWVAAEEHRPDLQHLPVEAILGRLLDVYPGVHVTTLGIRLSLSSDRYTRVPPVPLPQLARHVSTFSIGIAPLSPALGLNHARSSIKLKEYAAVGVPWLASPIGPYAGLGEKQGGRLVADDRWYEALEALLGNDRARRKLAKRAMRWGREQLLSRNVERWERAFDRLLARTPAAA